MEDTANPLNPTALGALLAEEYTMNPYTPLPSFLEMMMIEETASSGRRFLMSTLDAAVAYASSMSRASTLEANLWLKIRVSAAHLLESVGRNYSSEVRMIISYLMELRCLKSNSCATLAESMFGARRAKLGASSHTSNNDAKSYRKVLPLTERDKTRLALIVALGPYAKEKLDTLFQRLSREQSTQPFGSSGSGEELDKWTRLRFRMRSIYVMMYPFLHMTHEGTMLAYEWSYLVGRSLFFSPSSHFLGLVVRRATTADMQSVQNDKSSTHSKYLAGDGVRRSTLRGLRLAGVTCVSAALVVGWISQFRREMRRRRREVFLDGDSPRAGLSNDIPPPQSPRLRIQESDRIRQLPEDIDLCPLCRKPRINPAASTSGHVFCYRCLLLYIREHGTCPLTGLSCPESEILRLYEPHRVT